MVDERRTLSSPSQCTHQIYIHLHIAGRETHSRGLRVGCCLTLGNELYRETHVLNKQETLLGKDTGQRPGIKRPSRTLSRGSQSQVLWGWD